MNKLIIARKQKGLTQEEAAELIGVSYSLLQKMEQGLKSGNDKSKKKIAQFYKLPVGYLFFDEEITKGERKTKIRS